MLLRRSVISLFASTMIVTGAHAADLDENYGYADQMPAAPEIPQQKIEFGTGWYVRGDLGATTLPSLNLSPPALPTPGNLFNPSAPGLTVQKGSQAGYVASLGAGYAFTKWIRGEIMADFHQPLRTSSVSGNGNVFCPTGVTYPSKVTNADGSITWGAPDYADGACTGHYTTRLQTYDVLVNGYIDVGTWYHVTPYVGAGVGVAFGHYQQSSTYIQANSVPYQVSFVDPKYGATYYYNYDRSGSGTYYNFAYALMAGVAIDVFDHTKLDVGYRYLNVGSIPTISGKLSYNEVRAGLRYMIDN